MRYGQHSYNSQKTKTGCNLLHPVSYYQSAIYLFRNIPFAQNEFVAAVVCLPHLRFAGAVVFYVVDDVYQLALKGAEKHTVSRIVGEERLRLLNPRSGDCARFGITDALQVTILAPS